MTENQTVHATFRGGPFDGQEADLPSKLTYVELNPPEDPDKRFIYRRIDWDPEFPHLANFTFFTYEDDVKFREEEERRFRI